MGRGRYLDGGKIVEIVRPRFGPLEEDQPSPESRRSDAPSSLLGLGRAWTRVGYVVLFLAALAFVLNLTVRPIQAVQILTPLSGKQTASVGSATLDTPKGKVVVPPGFQAETVDGMVQAFPLGYRLIGGKGGGIALKPTAVGVTSVFLYIFSALASFVWTFVDIVDRRKRFVWLLPLFICPLVASLHALPLALYLFFARETLGHSEGVQ